MKRPRNPARDAIWRAMVERAEALHDAIVLGQTRATTRSAIHIAALAADLSSLAQALRVIAGHRQ